MMRPIAPEWDFEPVTQRCPDLSRKLAEEHEMLLHGDTEPPPGETVLDYHLRTCA